MKTCASFSIIPRPIIKEQKIKQHTNTLQTLSKTE